MRVLIEGYGYRAEAVRDVLHELGPLERATGEMSVWYVGYYYHAQLQDCVFILPKVLMDGENRVFSKYNPHDIINLDHAASLTPKERSFLYDFAVWIYRAIAVYNKSNPGNDIVYQRRIAALGQRERVRSNTFLDILLAIIRFNREHRDYLTTVLRNLHSGYNKIEWARTIAHSTAWVAQGVPVYFDLVNRERKVNDDEELLVIYYSILQYIHDTYGFPVSILFDFDLIRGRKFENYVHGYGKRRLKQIKYRYFSDVQLRMWELCYAFFDKAQGIRIASERREYLLVKSFNIVFEAIIDELIGDKDVPRGLKDQGDGKRVDHMYSYQSLTCNEGERLVYYIGDSKYYGIGSRISSEAVYKQFTYARNVIQWNVNLLLDACAQNGPLRQQHARCRDDLTEGYNIVPNFFISAKMEGSLSNDVKNVSITNRKNGIFFTRHFDNRLFDRDTLLVYHYEVNFLYVLSLYAREDGAQKAQWRRKVREYFREEIQKALQERYDFYVMEPRSGTRSEEYVRTHFKELLGKVYRPFEDNPSYLLLALDKGCREENGVLLSELNHAFFVRLCPLGEDPRRVFGDD